MKTRKLIYIAVPALLGLIFFLPPVANLVFNMGSMVLRHPLADFWLYCIRSISLTVFLFSLTLALAVYFEETFFDYAKKLLIPILLTLSSISFIVLALQSKDLWYDEMFTLRTAGTKSFKSFLKLSFADFQAPFHFWILHFPAVLSNSNVTVARLVSTLPILIFLWTGALFLKKNFSTSAAVLFILFSTTSKPVISYSFEVRGYSWAFLFIGFTVITLWYCLNSDKKLWKILFALSVLATTLTHYFAALAALIITAFYIVRILIKNKKLFFKLIILILVLIIVSIPNIQALLKHITRLKNGNFWIQKPTLDTVLESFRLTFFLDSNRLFRTGVITSAVFIFAALYFIQILVAFFKKKPLNNSYYLTILYLVSPLTILAVLIASYIIRPLLYPRYIFPCGAAFLIYVSIITGKIIPRKIKFVFCFILLWFCMYNHYSAFNSEKQTNISYENFRTSVDDFITDNTTFLYLDSEAISLGHDREVTRFYYPENKVIVKKVDSFENVLNDRSLLEEYKEIRPLIIVTQNMDFNSQWFSEYDYRLLSPSIYEPYRYYFIK